MIKRIRLTSPSVRFTLIFISIISQLSVAQGQAVPKYVVRESPSKTQICAHSIEQMGNIIVAMRDYNMTQERVIAKGMCSIIHSGVIGTIEVDYQTMDEFEYVEFYVPKEKKTYYLFKSALEPISDSVAQQKEKTEKAVKKEKQGTSKNRYRVRGSDTGYHPLATSQDAFEGLLLAYETGDDAFFSRMVSVGNIHLMPTGSIVSVEREEKIRGIIAVLVRTDDGRTGWMMKKVLQKTSSK